MSTRAVTHFVGWGKTQAIIYRHPDGYPEGLGQDLLDFLAEVQENCEDTRFNDASYLAARWVVRDGQRYAHKFGRVNGEFKETPAHPLDFISVGIRMDEPGDIEYRYYVTCGGGGIPTVEVEGVRYSGEGVGRMSIADAIAKQQEDEEDE